MNKAVIALGTNMGDRIGNLNLALRAISRLPNVRIVAGSKVYETDPVGITDQNKFYNAVVLVETGVSPLNLLGSCLGIEAAMGRIRTVKNGARIIDLDLLLYENFKCETSELTLPHPRMLERAFVLRPLSDIFPGDRALGLLYSPYLKELDDAGIQVTDYELIIPEQENYYDM